jgi:hypothetical protein
MRAENPGADGFKQLVPARIVRDNADVIFDADLVDRGDLLLLRPVLEMDRVFDVNRESKLLCEPFQGRPLLACPLDGGPQAKSQLGSAGPVKGVIAVDDLPSLLARFGKEVRFLADLLHGP